MSDNNTRLRRFLKRFLHEWVKPILIVVIVVGSLRSAVADWNDVPTGSMRPTILEGDRIFVNKLAYDLKVPFTSWRLAEWDGPRRGDVIVFFSPESGVRMVKRVIGLPGERIRLENNRLLIDDESAEYVALDPDTFEEIAPDQRIANDFATERLSTMDHPIMTINTESYAVQRRRSFGWTKVPPDHYFVMGDNRDRSRDSRWFGFVPRDAIAGQATAIAISLDPERHYRPRWGRFFSALK